MPGQQDTLDHAQPDHAQRDLDELTSIVSHDLKEPLRGMGIYCELMLEDYAEKLEAEGLRRLRTMHKICHRLEGMIDNLLAYYRLRHVPRAQSEADLNAVAEQAIDTLWPMIERRRALVRVAGRLPPAAVDPTLLCTVLGNLIANALKFNDSPRPWVEIGVAGRQPPTIYVRDNGIGVPREHHETIFALFSRLHSRKKYDGSGLGLAIVRRIVESYGGRVWLESEPGQGTTFYFSLAPAYAPPADPPVAGPPHWVLEAPNLKSQITAVPLSSCEIDGTTDRVTCYVAK